MEWQEKLQRVILKTEDCKDEVIRKAAFDIALQRVILKTEDCK